MRTMSDVEAIKQDLQGKGVKYCIGAYVDIHGVPKGKVVPISHFENFASGSELYTGYALDGLGQSPNDDEIASLPDLERGIQLPWQKEVAWFPADNTYHGESYPLNTRNVLKGVLARAAEKGWKFNLGIECEVYFLKLTDDGRLEVANKDDNLSKAAYDVKRFLDSYPMLDEIAGYIDDLGWGLYSFDHEDGHGQFEFDFGYSDALTMCDRYIFFRYMAKQVAAKYGLIATFMPKPFGDKTGNGAHFNMSLASLETGENLFKQADRSDPYGLGLSTLGYQFTAGILRHGQALCAAWAPTVNSYKRLVRRGLMGYYSWAPFSTPSAPTTAPTRSAFPWRVGGWSPAMPTRAATRISPRPSRLRPDSRASSNNSIPGHRARRTFTNIPMPSSLNSASSICLDRSAKLSRPSTAIHSSSRFSGRN